MSLIPRYPTGQGGSSSGSDVTNTNYFLIFAEESGDLDSGISEWSFGNGNETPSHNGIVFPFECELFALSLAKEGNGTVIVSAEKNASEAARITLASADRRSAITLDNPVVYQQNDWLNFRTIQGNASSDGAVIAAWMRAA